MQVAVIQVSADDIAEVGTEESIGALKSQLPIGPDTLRLAISCKNRYSEGHEGSIQMIQSNMRWISDAFETACWNTQRVRVAFSMDCCDREIMSYTGTTGGICENIARDLIAEVIDGTRSLPVACPDQLRRYGCIDGILDA